MAQAEADREDLLREATALVRRVELLAPGEADPVVAGFRRDGAASLFFGADPVWQFNAQGELRRGYRQGKLLAARGGRLVELARERTAAATHLVSRRLSEAEQAACLHEARDRLAALESALARGACRVVGQVPAADDVAKRLCEWLATLPAALVVARYPHAG